MLRQAAQRTIPQSIAQRRKQIFFGADNFGAQFDQLLQDTLLGDSIPAFFQKKELEAFVNKPLPVAFYIEMKSTLASIVMLDKIFHLS